MANRRSSVLATSNRSSAASAASVTEEKKQAATPLPVISEANASEEKAMTLKVTEME